MKKSEFVKGFVKNVKAMRENTNGTDYWYLWTDDDDNDWAIVLGATEGFEDSTTLAAKVAYQPSNSIMQCDYDIDWTMPYDKETGEVDACDWFIDSTDNDDKLREIARDLWKCAMTYRAA